MARQGQSFATAQEVRVVLPAKDGNDDMLVDVPKDGKSVGEIITRGNIVMTEVSKTISTRRVLGLMLCSTSGIQGLRGKPSVVVTSIVGIWL